MIAIEDAFERLRGRKPSDKERQGLMRARDALGLKDNDALWLLLMVLGHYETLYGRFPSLIAKAAADVTEGAKTAAEAELSWTAARTVSRLVLSRMSTTLPRSVKAGWPRMPARW